MGGKSMPPDDSISRVGCTLALRHTALIDHRDFESMPGVLDDKIVDLKQASHSSAECQACTHERNLHCAGGVSTNLPHHYTA